MKSFLLARVLLTWAFFVPVAILNGAIREKVYRPKVGELHAHQISTALASGAFFCLAFFMLKQKVAQLDMTKLLLIGGWWIGLTMLFEFAFGHYVMKKTWKNLFYDYNLRKGRVWSLFLLTELMSPLLARFISDRYPRHNRLCDESKV